MPTSSEDSLPTMEEFLNGYLPKQIDKDSIDAKEMVNELRRLGLPPDKADNMDRVFRTRMEAGDTIAFSIFKDATMCLTIVDPENGILESKTIQGFTMKEVSEFHEAFSRFNKKD